jgi:hypothetical protein
MDLKLRFDRSAVQEILEPGDEVEITITGEFLDGTKFEGLDNIRVINLSWLEILILILICLHNKHKKEKKNK